MKSASLVRAPAAEDNLMPVRVVTLVRAVLVREAAADAAAEAVEEDSLAREVVLRVVPQLVETSARSDLLPMAVEDHLVEMTTTKVVMITKLVLPEEAVVVTEVATTTVAKVAMRTDLEVLVQEAAPEEMVEIMDTAVVLVLPVAALPSEAASAVAEAAPEAALVDTVVLPVAVVVAIEETVAVLADTKAATKAVTTDTTDHYLHR